jgi:hypothetical protein
MGFLDSIENHLKNGRYNEMLEEFEQHLENEESGVFDKDFHYLPEGQNKLARLYQRYEELRKTCRIKDVRPLFQIQVTTYDSPVDLQKLADSLEAELAEYAFPKSRVSLIVIDDSDDSSCLAENRNICRKMRSYPLFYYGPKEQKALIREMAPGKKDLEVFLPALNKTAKDFHSEDLCSWGHKGVAGAMNMAFLASGKKALRKKNIWTVSIDEDVSFGQYVRVRSDKKNYAQHHSFSYFHRLAKVLSLAGGGIDLILGGITGDSTTPKQADAVVERFAAEYGRLLRDEKRKLRPQDLAQIFLDNFPTFDLEWVNNPYLPAKAGFSGTRGSAAEGKLGLDGKNTSGVHYIMSRRFLQEMDYCYFGPGRVADARFFLLAQNDSRFRTGETGSLCLSHTKTSKDPSHKLLRELSEHLRDEYTFIGYNFSLFYVLYTRRSRQIPWEKLKEPALREDLADEIKKTLVKKLSLVGSSLQFQKDALARYQKAAEAVEKASRDFPDGSAVKNQFAETRSELDGVCRMMEDCYGCHDELFFAGIDLFMEGIEKFLAWQKGRNQAPEG